MNVVVLVGRLSSAPRRTELPSGDELWAFELSCESDPSAAVPAILSVPVSVAAPITGIERYDTGSELVVAGVVRRRFYRSGGVTQSRTEVVAQSVVEVTARRPVERALTMAVRAIGREPAQRLRAVLPDTGAA